jgi:antitoxin VapB
MGLNIKNPQTERLVKELAEMTGESMTGAVTEAVLQRLERLRGKATGSMADRLLAIGRDCAARLPEPYRFRDHADLLYGDDGLPK